jgi:hypothetical protein
LTRNIREAIEGCLSVALEKIPTTSRDRVLELAV